MSRALSALALTALVACVTPARSFEVYEAKAAQAAEEILSAVETARLAIEVSRGGAFAPTLAVTIAEAEEDAAGAHGVFGSVQPPDARSDRLRRDLDAIATGAVSHLAELRIAARRGDREGLEQLGPALREDAERLRAFSDAHS